MAGLLKLYLRELPDPLVPFELYGRCIDAVRHNREWQANQYVTTRFGHLLASGRTPTHHMLCVDSCTAPDTRDALMKIAQEFPTEHYILSARLYTLLRKIASNSSTNLMSTSNLAIVIGPNVRFVLPFCNVYG